MQKSAGVSLAQCSSKNLSISFSSNIVVTMWKRELTLNMNIGIYKNDYISLIYADVLQILLILIRTTKQQQFNGYDPAALSLFPMYFSNAIHASNCHHVT